jgi:hypothetical protein
VWIIRAWLQISPQLTVKGFKKCCISNAVDGTDVDMLRNGSKRMGMLGLSVRKMKAVTVTLMGEADRL